MSWTPDSWREREALQQPQYPDSEALASVTRKLQQLPPLVHPRECDHLKTHLAKVCDGDTFLLWGGDCAESFDMCTPKSIENKFKILLQMSMIIIFKGRKPVLRIARMAGQYGKPRSSPTETVEGETVHTYKGDMVNGLEVGDRVPDPQRLLEGYFHSAVTLNYLRTLNVGGEASLEATKNFHLNEMLSPYLKIEYERITALIHDAFDFFRSTGNVSNVDSVELFTSHEGLLLEYEEAMTHQDRVGVWYNGSAHMLWIGDRTRALSGAHIEFFRGLANPVAVKVGPTMTVPELVELIGILNPKREKGKLTLITRYGRSKVAQFLPEQVRAVQATGIPVVWVCDPCHGNTKSTADGRKTRHFADMVSEISSCFEILTQNGAHLGGVHLELTGENVTECTGGATELSEGDLGALYTTACDPRLNYTQGLEVAFRIGATLQAQREAQGENSKK